MNLEDLLTPEYEVHIICNKKENYTEMTGNIPSLLTALSVYVMNLKSEGVSKETIIYAVNQGLDKVEKDSEKIDKELKELIKKLFN